MHRQILFKVERQRVLVPVGVPCPFGCRYCYTRGGEVGLAHVDASEILSRFRTVRPVLPHIADEEYERIVIEGVKASCDGFILGPLYADDRGQFVRGLPPEILAAVPHRRCTVSWSAHAPVWTRYEDEARLQRLTVMIEEHGGRVFLSSADAMALVSRERTAA